MVHNDEQPFNVPHVNCGLRTFGIHACVAKFSHKPSRPQRGLNYRFAAFSITFLPVNIFIFVQMLLAKRKLLRRVLEEDRGRMCSQTLSSSHRLLLSSQPNLRFNNQPPVKCHCKDTTTSLQYPDCVIKKPNQIVSTQGDIIHYLRLNLTEYSKSLTTTWLGVKNNIWRKQVKTNELLINL